MDPAAVTRDLDGDAPSTRGAGQSAGEAGHAGADPLLVVSGVAEQERLPLERVDLASGAERAPSHPQRLHEHAFRGRLLDRARARDARREPGHEMEPRRIGCHAELLDEAFPRRGLQKGGLPLGVQGAHAA
jgi:hypothetical protein